MSIERLQNKYMQSLAEPFNVLQDSLSRQYARSPTESRINVEVGNLATSIHHFVELLSPDNYRNARRQLFEKSADIRLLGNFADTYKHGDRGKRCLEVDLTVRAIFEYKSNLGFRFIRNQAVIFFRDQDFRQRCAGAKYCSVDVDFLDLARKSICTLAKLVGLSDDRLLSDSGPTEKNFSSSATLYLHKDAREVRIEGIRISFVEIQADGSCRFVSPDNVKFQILERIEIDSVVSSSL